MKKTKKSSVRIVEVGMRDGLQNEKVNLDQSVRIEFAHRLIDAGITNIEAGSFVRPDWVPQMAGSGEIIRTLLGEQKNRKISSKVRLAALVPNERGMRDALQTQIKEVAIFAACSESFSQKNMNSSITESFKRFKPVMDLARENDIAVRGYLSVCFGCPFEGKVSESRVIKLAEKMLKLGVYEISIGDTIGIANVAQVYSLMTKLKKAIGAKYLAGHFHDTRGQALANILASYDVGVRTFDSSLGGLGGCPYAPGATGNVATEDVVYMFQSLGELKEIKLPKLVETNQWMSQQMKRALSSKYSTAAVGASK